MGVLSDLFQKNREWARRIETQSPGFFAKLAEQQSPLFFWIGCADSRVPANEIVGLMPGEVFVHRNIANIVNAADPNCMSCLQYAVDILKVRHILVVGHYGCGGIRAVLAGQTAGQIGEWLAPARAVFEKYAARLTGDEQARWNKLCELNTIEQAAAVWDSPIVRDAWARGQEIAVHGWIYAVGDGLLRDLNVTAASPGEADDVRKRLESKP